MARASTAAGRAPAATISLTRLELLTAAGALAELAKHVLGWRTKIRVTQLLRAVQLHVQDTQSGREAITEKFAARDDAGDVVYVDEKRELVRLSDPKGAQRELDALLQERVALAGAPLELKDLRDLKRPSDVVLDAVQLARLGPLLIIPDEIPETL